MNLTDAQLMQFVHTLSFGQKVRFLRKQNFLSISDFAERIGFSRRTIYNWEHEKAEPNSISTVERLCSFFHVDIAFFLPNATCYQTGIQSDAALWQNFKEYCEEAISS